MAWTAPRTWATGEVVTNSLNNTHLRDNQLGLTDGYCLGPQDFFLGAGAAHALIGVASLRPLDAWAFDAAASEYVTAVRLLPSFLRGGTTYVTLYWTPELNGTGAVVWRAHLTTVASGEMIDQAADETVTITHTLSVGSADLLLLTTPTASTSGLAGPLCRIVIERLGTDAGDTLAGDARLLGVLLTK